MAVQRHLLLFTLCWFLAACSGGNPEPRPAVTRTPTLPAQTTGTVPTAAAPTPTTAPAVRATREPPPDLLTVGGMTAPQDVDWYGLDTGDPLAFTLGLWLNRSLVDAARPAEQLASGWSVSGQQITFELREGVEWSDGAPIRAADVADILQQAVDEGELTGIRRIRSDARQLMVSVDGDVCPVLTRVAAYPVIDVREFPPVRTSSGAVVEALDGNAWRFRNVAGGDAIYRTFEDEHDLRDAWTAGEIDAVAGASRLSLGPLPGARRAGVEPSNQLAALLFHLDDPVVRSQPLRQALALALDRAALYEEAYGIAAPRLPSALLMPSHWASPERPLEQDRGAAAERLEEAGWRDRDGDGIRENGAGEPLAVTLMAPLSPDEQWEAVAHGLVAQWRAMGVDARLQFVESYPLQERLHDGRWQVALVAYRLDPDPDQRALWTPPAPDDLVGQDLNVTGYGDPAVTDLLDRAARVPGCDLTARATLYGQAWEQILEDTPVLPLFPLPLDIVVK